MAQKGWIWVAALVVGAACGGSAVIDAGDGDDTNPGNGGAGMTNPNGGDGGEGGDVIDNRCADIFAEHAARLEGAKMCNPALATPQCTLTVNQDLICGCDFTFVNPENVGAVTELDKLAEAWNVNQCNAGNPPCPPDCSTPTSGVCGTDGRCYDN